MERLIQSAGCTNGRGARGAPACCCLAAGPAPHHPTSRLSSTGVSPPVTPAGGGGGQFFPLRWHMGIWSRTRCFPRPLSLRIRSGKRRRKRWRGREAESQVWHGKKAHCFDGASIRHTNIYTRTVEKPKHPLPARLRATASGPHISGLLVVRWCGWYVL